jgi:hypothetical protein
MLEIEKLRGEAIDAARSVEMARLKLEAESRNAFSASAEAHRSQQRVESIEETLRGAWGAVSSAVTAPPQDSTEAVDRRGPPPPLSVPAAPVKSSSGPAPASRSLVQLEAIRPPPRPVPAVSLRVDAPTNSHSAYMFSLPSQPLERLVTVSYELRAAEVEQQLSEVLWDEDDSIEIACISDCSRGTVDLYAAEEQPFEGFEYTDAPKRNENGSVLSGSVRVKLPPYGGNYVAVYVRQELVISEGPGAANGITESKASGGMDDEHDQKEFLSGGAPAGRSSVSISRRRLILATSEPFHVAGSVFPCGPDTVLPGGRSVRRRGAKPMAPITIDSCAELNYARPEVYVNAGESSRLELQVQLSLDYPVSVHAAAASGADAPQVPCRRVASRVMGWAFRGSSLEGVRVVIEADVFEVRDYDRIGAIIDTRSTKYWAVDITNLSSFISTSSSSLSCEGSPASGMSAALRAEDGINIIGAELKIDTASRRLLLALITDRVFSPPSLQKRHALAEAALEAEIKCRFCGHTLCRGAFAVLCDKWATDNLQPGSASLGARLQELLRAEDTDRDVCIYLHGGNVLACVISSRINGVTDTGIQRSGDDLSCARCMCSVGDTGVMYGHCVSVVRLPSVGMGGIENIIASLVLRNAECGRTELRIYSNSTCGMSVPGSNHSLILKSRWPRQFCLVTRKEFDSIRKQNRIFGAESLKTDTWIEVIRVECTFESEALIYCTTLPSVSLEHEDFAQVTSSFVFASALKDHFDISVAFYLVISYKRNL